MDRSHDDAPLHKIVERFLKVENHKAAVAISYFAYNFIKIAARNGGWRGGSTV